MTKPDFLTEFETASTAQQEAAKICQRIFEEWLEDQPVVYGRKETGSTDGLCGFAELRYSYDTHKARLVCVEPIKPEECEHPTKSILSPNISFDLFRCLECGHFIKPKGWEIIE